MYSVLYQLFIYGYRLFSWVESFLLQMTDGGSVRKPVSETLCIAF